MAPPKSLKQVSRKSVLSTAGVGFRVQVRGMVQKSVLSTAGVGFGPKVQIDPEGSRSEVRSLKQVTGKSVLSTAGVGFRVRGQRSKIESVWSQMLSDLDWVWSLKQVSRKSVLSTAEVGLWVQVRGLRGPLLIMYGPPPTVLLLMFSLSLEGAGRKLSSLIIKQITDNYDS